MGKEKLKPRDLTQVRAEVEQIKDRLGKEIDAKIRDLVIGLRRWGINTLGSCEGHQDALPYPWVDIDPKDIQKAAIILSHWWPGRDENRPAADVPRWVLKPFAGIVRIIPEDKHSRKLEEMQEEAMRFGKWLQELPDDYFVS